MNQDPSSGNGPFDEISRRGALLFAAIAVGTAACSSLPSGSSSTGETSPSSIVSVSPPEMTPTPETTDPDIALHDQYRKEVGVAPGLMDFISFPTTEQEAEDQAAQLATTLKGWNTAGVMPIVVMEPTDNGNPTVDLEKMASGEYDGAMEKFFSSLKDAGVTDEQMGTWVPLPESNTPVWDNGVTDPELFTKNVTKIVKTAKKYFPNAAFSVMLDSQTFTTNPDPNWTSGTMDPNALLKFLDFEPGLIDSFGLQGFPWTNEDKASVFLSAQAVIAGAQKLGVEHVWFNTGSYSTVNNPNGLGIIHAGKNDKQIAKERAGALQNEFAQILAVQNAGLHVDFVNLFAQNTLPQGSGNADYQYSSSQDLGVLRSFVSTAKSHRIPVTLFDATQ